MGDGSEADWRREVQFWKQAGVHRVTLNTTFTAFFFASRLGVSVTEVAGTIAILSLGGIFAVTLGALGGGFLSDRLRRRRVFVLSSGLIFGAGAVGKVFAGVEPEDGG